MTDTVAPTIEAPVEPLPRRRISRKSPIVDAVLAIGLFTVALLFRWHFPRDGLFYDDSWQAFGAVTGHFSQFLTVGQTQPGFALGLMVWSRVFGSTAATMVTPALIAGALGPAVLYLALRKFRFAVSISFLLGAALTVSETAIAYSGRVKSYTSDVLVILLLCVLLPSLARRRWTVAIGVAWFAGSVAIASFSSFMLLASIAAGAVLIFHTRDDRRIRMIAVGAQAVGILAVFAAEGRTHDATSLTNSFKASESYIQFHVNPVTFGGEIVKHLVRVTNIFPGGPGLVSVACMVAAVVGLATMALRGSRAIVGRFLVAVVLLAMAGSLATQVPFGPLTSSARVTLWLAPAVAFGLAVVVQLVYRAATVRGNAMRLAFDVAAFGLAALLLVSAIGVRRAYPASAALATQRAMAEAGPQDVIIVARSALYTFALEADTPVTLRPTPSLIVGYKPAFRDERLHPVDFLTSAAKANIISALKNANRAYIVDSTVDPGGYKKYRSDLAALVASQGFKQQNEPSKVGTGTLTVWLRPGTAP